MMRLQNRLFPRLAVRRQPRRRIHRQNQRWPHRRRIPRLIVEVTNRAPNRTARNSAKSRPKHRVNNHIRSQHPRSNASPLGFIRYKQDFPAKLSPPPKISGRVPAQLFFAREQHNKHIRRGTGAPVCAPTVPPPPSAANAEPPQTHPRHCFPSRKAHKSHAAAPAPHRESPPRKHSPPASPPSPSIAAQKSQAARSSADQPRASPPLLMLS